MIALPALEGLGGLPTAAASGVSTAQSVSPTRLAFLYVPNGVHYRSWKPEQTGTNYELTETLKPLEKYRSDITIFSGLSQHNAHALGDGPGDHARGAAVFLTGEHPVKSAGKDIRAGVSVDQIAARHLGRDTRFASLELGSEPGKLAGSCDSGYGCAYSNTISWKSPTQPVEKETNPAVLFDRLFGGGSATEQRQSQQRRRHTRQSILDFVANDARQLRGRLSASDRRKVEQYLEGVREVERRLENPALVAGDGPWLARPDGPPDELGERIRLMGDMMVLAFASDATRVCTLMFGNEGSNYPYRELGHSEGHHSLSHHRRQRDMVRQIEEINQYHVKQLVYVLDKLSQPDEQGNRLLDSTLLVYGSGIGDGDRHNHDNLPIVVAGRGNGLITPGRHVEYSEETPLMNLFLSMLHGVGVDIDRVGDSTGPLPGLVV
jgi:hypothetical protein